VSHFRPSLSAHLLRTVPLLTLLLAPSLPCMAAETTPDPAAPSSAHQAASEAVELVARAGFDAATTVELLLPLAASDHPELLMTLAFAQMELAVGGRDPQQVTAADIAPTLASAERALALGHGGAGNLLSVIYSNGMGVAADVPRAKAYLQQGVALGDPSARLNLALRQFNGRPPFARDTSAACAHFDALWAANYSRAIVGHYLGLGRLHGLCGGAPDPKAAAELFQVAAEEGNPEAARDLGRLLEDGSVGEPDPVAAHAWFERAASAGEPYSQWRTGVAFATGQTVDRDPVKAVERLRAAAAQSYPDALTSLAVMYASGEGIEQDFTEARRLYLQATELGSTHAWRNLAAMSLTGQGGKVDPAQAQDYYQRYLASGNSDDVALSAAIEAKLDRGDRRRAERLHRAWLRQQSRK
jgi:TPR repeat protein